MEMATTPMTSSDNSPGTGGFLNPEVLINEFGLRPGMTVADFGSGAGYFTVLMAERVGKEGRVYALDIMESALDSVREKAKTSGLENVEIIKTNLEVAGNSGLADQSQDIVLLANILFQSDKKAEIEREAKRILKDGGAMIIVDWKKNADIVSEDLPIGQAGRQGFGPPDNLRTDEAAIRSLAVEEGFRFEKSFDAGQFHFGMMLRK